MQTTTATPLLYAGDGSRFRAKSDAATEISKQWFVYMSFSHEPAPETICRVAQPMHQIAPFLSAENCTMAAIARRQCADPWPTFVISPLAPMQSQTLQFPLKGALGNAELARQAYAATSTTPPPLAPDRVVPAPPAESLQPTGRGILGNQSTREVWNFL